MAKLIDLTGKTVHRVSVLKRGPDFDGNSDTRVQWYILCHICKKQSLVVARDLKRYSTKFKNGCKDCRNRCKQ